MKKRVLMTLVVTVVLLAVTALGVLSASSSAPNWDISGTWMGRSGLVGHLDYPFTMVLSQDNAGNVTGSINYTTGQSGSISGHLTGDTFVFIRTDASGYWATCDACEITWTPAGAFSFAGEGRDNLGSPHRFVAWQATGAASVLPADVGDCLPGSYPGWTHVETLFVSAVGSGSNTPVVSSSPLVPGMTYLVEASGTYFAGGTGRYDIRADAEYSEDAYQRANGLPWTDLVRNYEGYGEGLLELKVDGQFVEWGDFSPDHVYTLPWTGTGSPLTFEFQIYDIYAQNNTGGLCTAISFCPPTVEWLPPITLPDWTLNENATLPIKFQLYDCSGNVLTTDLRPSLTVTPPGDITDLRFDPVEYYYIANFRPLQNSEHTAFISLDSVQLGSQGFEVVEPGKANGRGRGNN
jgi:hypothetical protein